MLSPEALAASVTAAAISMAKDRSDDELNLLSAVFSQLGDTLSTIAVQRGIIETCRKKDEATIKDEGAKPGSKSRGTENEKDVKPESKSEENEKSDEENSDENNKK